MNDVASRPIDGSGMPADLIDITHPSYPVQVEVRQDGSVLWIHVGPRTVLRICRIERLIVIDHRPEKARGQEVAP